MTNLSISTFLNKIKSKRFLDFILLTSGQNIKFIFPLITLPYVLHIFNYEEYGVIVTSASLANYLGIFIDFGFIFTANRLIAKNLGNQNKIKEIFNSVLTTKLLLFSLLIILFAIWVNSNSKYSQYSTIYLCNALVLLSNVFIPLWYFQAVRKLHIPMYIDIIAKTINLILLFILVKTSQDLLIFTIINLVTSIVSILLTLFYLYLKENLIFVPKFNLKSIFYQLKDGLYAFGVVIVSNSFTLFNILFISYFFNYEIAAIYGVADRIFNLVFSIQNSLINVYYTDIMSQNTIANLKVQSLKLLKHLVPLSVLLFILLNTIGILILHYILHGKYDESFYFIHILSISLLLNIFNPILSLRLLALHLEKYTMISTALGVLILIGLNTIAIYLHNSNLVVINYIIAEFLLLILLFIVSYYKLHKQSRK